MILATPYGKRDEAGRAAYQRLANASPFPVRSLHLSAFHPKERAWRATDKIALLKCDALVLSNHGPLADAWARLCRETPIIAIAHNDEEDTYAEFKACEAHCDSYAAVSLAVFQSLKILARKSPPLTLLHIPYGVPIQEDPEPARRTGESQGLAVCRL